MEAIDWLERNSEGFAALQGPERTAPMHFALLWSYFEAAALNTNASFNAIETWVRDLHRQGKLNHEVFAPALDYFKHRYLRYGDFTHHFNSLHFPANDSRELVEEVLSDTNLDPVDSVVATFFIIYRFRNNYFHGRKWAYELQDQFQNFTVANNAIMAAMDMWRE